MSRFGGTPKRKRNSCFFYVSNVLGTYELHVGYKTSKSVIQPLSNSKASAPVKVPFGPPTSCEYLMRNLPGGESIAEYKFTNNRSQTVALKDTLLNNMEFGVSNFARKVTSMTVEGKKKLLALYLSQVNFCEHFIYHREGVHDSDGIAGGEVLGRITDAGGSLEDLRKFVELVKESAQMVESPDKLLAQIREKSQTVMKRKSTVSVSEAVTDVAFKQPKMSKSEAIVENEKKELEDEGGLEKLYQNSLCGLAHIPLDNISVCPEMKSKMNPFRVQFIKNSMKKRYNPAISVLVVCPVNDEKKIDATHDKFYVVQKVKCLAAFKELDKVGEFKDLYGHNDRKVLCYILKTNKPEVMHYANLSENYISGQFASKVLPQDILHHFHCLTKKDKSVNAIKVVERMNRLCCLRSEDCTALERICKWSSNGFAAFMLVLENFELYGTTDANGPGHAKKIELGLKNNIPNVLMRSLGKCSEEFFTENHHQVLSKSMSLKELADRNHDVLQMQKLFKVLSKIAKYVPIETLQNLHPGKFDEDKLGDYIGAIYDEKVKNQKAVELEEYYERVISKPNTEIEKPVEFSVYSRVEDIFHNEELVDSDLIIYNIAKLDSDIINNIFNTVLGSDEEFRAAVLLFPSEQKYYEVLKFLRSQQAKTKMIKDIEIVPLLFNKDLKKGEATRIGENIHYGLLFGKFRLIKSPLLVHYTNLSQVSKVVACICPPQAAVTLVSDPGLALIQVHDCDLDWKVKYYGSEKDMDRFKKKLATDKKPVETDSSTLEMEDVEGNDGEASTSNTPVKPSTGRPEISLAPSQALPSSSVTCTPSPATIASTSKTPVKVPLSPAQFSPASSATCTPPPALMSGDKLDDSGFMERSPSVSKSLDFDS